MAQVAMVGAVNVLKTWDVLGTTAQMQLQGKR
jgi:hypothetical protein